MERLLSVPVSASTEFDDKARQLLSDIDRAFGSEPTLDKTVSPSGDFQKLNMRPDISGLFDKKSLEMKRATS